MINKVHIRYEDDVFNGEHPFSCGIVIDVRTINKFKSLNPYFLQKLSWETTDQKWKFDSAA